MKLILEDKTKISGIYNIRNIINGKIYIGSTVDIKYRHYKHFYELKNKIHDNDHLQSAWNKYGEQSFEMFMVDYIKDEEKDRKKFEKELKEAEQLHLNKHWIFENNDYDRSICYNSARYADRPPVLAGKDNPNYGKPISEKMKKSISEARKGKTYEEIFGVEKATKMRIACSERVSGKWHPNFGKHLSKKIREKISESKMGTRHSAKTIEKMRISSTGRRHTNKTKKLLSTLRIGEKNPMYGKENKWGFHTEKSKNKMSESRKGQRCGMLNNLFQGKVILQIDPKTNEIIAEFIGMSVAAKSVKKSSSNITACCKRRQKTAYGFIWRYKEENILQNNGEDK